MKKTLINFSQHSRETLQQLVLQRFGTNMQKNLMYNLFVGCKMIHCYPFKLVVAGNCCTLRHCTQREICTLIVQYNVEKILDLDNCFSSNNKILKIVKCSVQKCKNKYVLHNYVLLLQTSNNTLIYICGFFLH